MAKKPDKVRVSEPKSDYWIIEAKILVSSKVVFDSKITQKEAEKRFLAGDFDDILDEEHLEIISIEKSKAAED